MQKHASNLIRQFAGTEHRVHIITAADKHDSVVEYRAKISGNIKDENISYELIAFPRIFQFPGHYVLASWLFSRKVAKLCRETIKDYDLVYAKGFTSWYLTAHKKKYFPPVVVQLHGLEMFQQPYGLRDRLTRWLLKIPASGVIRHADAILSYGGKVRDILIKSGRKPSDIFEQYGAVDDFWMLPEPEKKANASTRHFLFVARYEFRKGYHILKPVLEKLISEKADFTIHLVGEIPDELHIQHPSVIYHGTLGAEELKVLKEKTEVLILCSLAEGFPTILVEAMARGLSPLATDVGAVNVVVNPHNGWLIEPGNVQDLHRAMKEAIVLDADALTEKQKKSRELISREFNWNSMFHALVSHFQTIINDHRNRIAGRKPETN